jgi:hypothetical protein
MFARPVFPDPNIYCATGFLIWCHGANANVEATRIADKMCGFGDRDGPDFWMKVEQAITELEAQPAIRPQQLGELNTMRSGTELAIIEKQDWRAAVLPKLVARWFVLSRLLPSAAPALPPAVAAIVAVALLGG